jgi:hypothetical protein
MSYQEKFEITAANGSYFSDQFDTLITGWREESDERHNRLLGYLKTFKGRVISLDTCENSEKLHYKIKHSNGSVEEVRDKSLIPDLQSFLAKEKISGANICVDITTLKQGILFLITNLLVNAVKPARFFGAYTEPATYRKREKFDIGETEEFDLYDKIIGSSNPVPGFNKTQSPRDILLVASMGFDSQRLQTIYENLKPKKIVPVVGFPSFVPGWNLTAIKMNYMILKGAECFDSIKSCASASPFEMYNLLNDEFQRHHRTYDIYISPLGTRPHCLGAALFASKNRNAYLVYDFPVEKKFRSENVLKTYIYNLSKYIDV